MDQGELEPVSFVVKLWIERPGPGLPPVVRLGRITLIRPTPDGRDESHGFHDLRELAPLIERWLSTMSR
jgi:hypothetical protein